MNLEKIREIEARKGYYDINFIRQSGIHSFFDEWVVDTLLGRGAFGSVYKVVKPQQDMTAQECALKVCQVNNPEDAELRKQEIETQRLLSGHPNAVQIEDYALISEEQNNTSFVIIRMELLNKLPEGGLNERETIKLGIDICSVLEKCASFEQKLVHCDIKPANILMTKDGRYKLGDFGVAKTLQATMTYTGNRGTPLYMAPEVAYFRGYDSRCDIFSLGYTMLTMLNGGKHPYEGVGERAEVLKAMYESKKMPQIKGVSAGLMKIIRKMCEPNPQARYSRASEVKRDLEVYVRKQEEAEKAAKLEAERQAEIAKQKAKAERAKNIKLASDALAKAEYDLKLAQGELEVALYDDKPKVEKKVEGLETTVQRAVRVQKFVTEGETYEGACRKVREEELAAVRQNKPTKRSKTKKKGLVAVFAILVVLVAAVALYIGGDFISRKITYQNSDSVERDGFVYSATDAGYVIIDYTGNKTNIVIPSEIEGVPVVEIWERAFKDNEELERVEISPGIEKIGLFAFANCNNLKYVYIPSTVEDIESFAFSTKYESQWYAIDGLTILGEQNSAAQQYAQALKIEFYIGKMNMISTTGDSVLTVSNYVKKDNFTLELADTGDYYIVDRYRSDSAYVVIPSTCNGLPVSKIGRHAFYAKDTLEKVVIPESVTHILPEAFLFCGSVTVYAPYEASYYNYTPEKGVTWKIQELAELLFEPKNNFYSVSGYTNSSGIVIIPKEYNSIPVRAIDSNAFKGCEDIEILVIPDSVYSIENGSFSGCSALRTVSLPNSVTTIYGRAFNDCVLLDNIVLPSSLETIEQYAFNNCASLKELVIPSNVKHIGNKAFNGCTTTITAPHEASYYGYEIDDGVTWIVE